MNYRTIACAVAAALAVTLQSATDAFANQPPPPPAVTPPAPPMTLWRFLGIPQTYTRIHDATFNRFGNFPGLERKPPVLRLADPLNLLSDNPAIRTAAEVKMQEDLAPQKIKAIKYLATIGCGCYPGVAEALMASLEDCTEDVRLAAAEGIAAAAGAQCTTCNVNTCCSVPMMQALAQRAYARDAEGCFIEPSEEVRQAVIAALEACCPDCLDTPVVIEPSTVPPDGPPTIPPDAPPTPPTIPPDASNRRQQFQPVSGQPIGQQGVERAGQAAHVAPIVQAREVAGQVVHVDPRSGRVTLQFAGQQPESGSIVKLYQSYLVGGTQHVADVRVVERTRDGVVAEPTSGGSLRAARGQRAVYRTFVPDTTVR